MGEDLFQSSDALRRATPLRHVRYLTLEGPLALELGGRLEGVRVAYETYGRLNERRDNAVLVCHALSGDSHVARHDPADDPGWWDLLVGPGRYIDTDRYFVVCSNILGSCRGTTGPNSLCPATGRPYGRDFPAVTIGDMVALQARLLDALGIETLLGVLGGSLGGMQVLAWAIQFPHRVRAALPIATAGRLSSQSLAFDIIGRNAITHDPDFNDGDYYEPQPGPMGTFAPARSVGGLALARMIGHITYLSPQAMREKFNENRHRPRAIDSAFEKDTSVASYLAYQGDKFVDRFDANSYLVISRAMDRFDLGEGPALVAALAPARCRWLVVSFTSDWLFPAEQSLDLVDALLDGNQPVSYCNVRSACGHDAFLLEDQLAMYGGLIGGFLARTHDASPPAEPEEDAEGNPDADTSIFHGRRIDYDSIEALIRADLGGSASVLDLGCGSGQLLLRLKRHGFCRLLGVDLHEQSVLATVRRGVDCIHADINEGLGMFGDRQFDCVLLSRTLQTVRAVDRVMDEMLRVGRRCVVSFPNFAYAPLRRMLAEEGKAPESSGLMRYKWYDTPNLRFFSIADFEDYCREKGVTVHRRLALNTERRAAVHDDPNRQADLAIFVISRP